MKVFTLRFISLFLSVLLAFSLVSCGGAGDDSKDSNKEDTTAQVKGPSASETFLEAAERASALESLRLETDIYIDRTVGCDTYSESVEQTIDIISFGEDGAVRVLERFDYCDGDYIYITEMFDTGKAYYTEGEDGKTYTAEMTAEEYFSRIVPVCILDASLYETVEFVKDDPRCIVFSDAKELEKWECGEGAQLISASGKAFLSEKGDVERMIYEAEYTLGPAELSVEYDVKLSETTLTREKLETPKAEDCVPLRHIDIPRIVLYAGRAIPEASALVAGVNEEIAINTGISYTQSYSFDLYDSVDDTFAAKLESYERITDINGSQEFSWKEEHKEGRSVSTPLEPAGKPQETQTTPEQFREYFAGRLSHYLPKEEYFESMTAVSTGELLLLEYDVAHLSDFGELCEDYVLSKIYQDPGFFDEYSEGYKTVTLKGYMGFDLETMLPTSAGLEYMGEHTVEGQALQIYFSISDAFTLSTEEAYTNVTEEYLPEKEPENVATPLFYEVTSEKGGKMYLLGTIHLGDERNAYLPDEIYEAFDAADALAVEINVDTVEDRIKENEALSEKAALSYYYSDGTGTADHVSEDMYEAAVQLMKMTGDYSGNAEYMRPSLWSSAIEGFMTKTHRRYYTFKGVDWRLIRRANESGKEIRDIESLEDSLTMDGKYSEAAHEYILGSTLSSSRGDYHEGLCELYEMWCEGNEKKIFEKMRASDEIPGTATREQIEAWESYMKIMMTDRDAVMVERAKEYLESGEVVFFAVGLAHVVGKTGLVDALRAAGYTVTLVEYK